MFENELWGLRRQLAHINQLDDKIRGHLDAVAQLNREESAKAERELEQAREREHAPAPVPPASPAPLPPHAQNKAMVIAGLRGIVAPPARDQHGRFEPAPPDERSQFARNKEAMQQGLRGGNL
jgi:hypothetical protein